MVTKSAVLGILAMTILAFPTTASAQELPGWFAFLSATPRVIWLKPLTVDSNEPELNQLLKKRHNVALEELIARHSEFLAGRGIDEFLYDAAIHLRNSRLELARDKAERLVIMQDHFAWTKLIKEIMKGRYEAGLVATKLYGEASYRRMQAEIDMLRLGDSK